jgi:hypothetical protein
MTAQALASPTAEIRRLRAERDELRRLIAALADALPDPLAEVEYRRRLCCEAAQAGRERAMSQGYAVAIADVKRTEHDIVHAIRLVARRRAAPGGAAWLAAVERHGGTEYGGTGQPRIPVPAAVIERAREVKTA